MTIYQLKVDISTPSLNLMLMAEKRSTNIKNQLLEFMNIHSKFQGNQVLTYIISWTNMLDGQTKTMKNCHFPLFGANYCYPRSIRIYRCVWLVIALMDRPNLSTSQRNIQQHLSLKALPLVGQKDVDYTRTVVNQIHRMLCAEWASLKWSISRLFPYTIK